MWHPDISFGFVNPSSEHQSQETELWFKIKNSLHDALVCNIAATIT